MRITTGTHEMKKKLADLPTPEHVAECYEKVDYLFRQLEIRLARVQLGLLLANVESKTPVRCHIDEAVVYGSTLRQIFKAEGALQVAAAQAYTIAPKEIH